MDHLVSASGNMGWGGGAGGGNVKHWLLACQNANCEALIVRFGHVKGQRVKHKTRAP